MIDLGVSLLDGAGAVVAVEQQVLRLVIQGPGPVGLAYGEPLLARRARSCPLVSSPQGLGKGGEPVDDQGIAYSLVFALLLLVGGAWATGTDVRAPSRSGWWASPGSQLSPGFRAARTC